MLNYQQGAPRGRNSWALALVGILGSLFITGSLARLLHVRNPLSSKQAMGLTSRELAPLKSGPGLVVCEPVAAGSDASLGQFGAGCGRWLHLMVAGRPEMGQSPDWGDMTRIPGELGRSDLRLTTEDAAKLSQLLGVTHVAVGRVEGSPEHCTLTYQLLEVPGLKAIGPPLIATGARSQIVSRLPAMAARLSGLLGVSVGTAPPQVGITAADLAFLGGLPWHPIGTFPAADRRRLEELSSRAPLAGLLFLKPSMSDTKQARRVVNQLLTQAPDNALVFSQIGWVDSAQLARSKAQFFHCLQQYPNNFLLNHASVWLHRATANPDGEIAAARQVVRCAPRNPEGWLSLGWTISQQGDRMRNGRTAGDLSQSEWSILTDVYGQWTDAVEHATQLDPLYGKAWLRLSTAASFAGRGDLADRAFWKAVTLEKDNPEVYWWGLEIYQPKWYDNPEKLARVARLGAAAASLPMAQQEYMAETLRSHGFDALAHEVLARVIATSQARLLHRPDDAEAHGALAEAYRLQGKTADEERESRVVVKILPKDAAGHYQLGVLLDRQKKSAEAASEYHRALCLDPRYSQAAVALGGVLMRLGQLDTAEQQLRALIREWPRWGEPRLSLGWVLLGQGKADEAISQARHVLSVSPCWSEPYRLLSKGLAVKGEYREAIRTGREGLYLAPRSAQAHAVLAYAYSRAGQQDDAVKECQAALGIDAAYAPAHLNLANALSAQGHDAEARAEWQRVLELDRGIFAQEARQKLASNGAHQ